MRARHGSNTGRKPARVITVTCSEGHQSEILETSIDLARCSEKTGFHKKCHAPIKRPT